MRCVAALLALLGLLCITGQGSAQLFGRAKAPVTPGAGKSVEDVLCSQQDFSTLCQLVRSARNDPTVAELLDPTFTGTIFAPTSEAFQTDQRRITRALGVASIADLQQKPALAARLIGNHIITGQALQFDQLKNDQKYKNALGQTLEIDTGLLGGKYVEGPVNTARISNKENNIPAARAYIHKMRGVLVTKS